MLHCLDSLTTAQVGCLDVCQINRSMSGWVSSFFFFFFFVAPPGSVYLGSVFMKEALQRAIEMTDAAYTRTSER